MSTTDTPHANPDQGGSYTRHPVTGALTAVQQPEPPAAVLRRDAQAPAEAPAPAEAAPVPAAPATPDLEA